MDSLSRRRFLALTGVALPAALGLAAVVRPARAQVAPPGQGRGAPPRVELRTRPGRQPRRRNFEVTEPEVVARVGEEVTFDGHKESRTLYVFLDREQGNYAPFEVDRLELAVGATRALPVRNGVPGRSYRYLVYLEAFDDLADGHSPPKIHIAQDF